MREFLFAILRAPFEHPLTLVARTELQSGFLSGVQDDRRIHRTAWN